MPQILEKRSHKRRHPVTLIKGELVIVEFGDFDPILEKSQLVSGVEGVASYIGVLKSQGNCSRELVIGHVI